MHKNNSKGFSVLIIMFVVMVAIALMVIVYSQSGNIDLNKSVDEQDSADLGIVDKSPELKAILEDKMMLVESELASNEELIDLVINQDEHDSHMEDHERMEIDEAWMEGGAEDFVKQHTSNEIALILLEFSENNPGFVEIIVTDEQGLNVGQTNRSSDFIQSDEQWWVDTYNDGEGKLYYGEIEFDESALSESISIYSPIYNQDQEVVGIIKAVLDLRSIQDEL